MFRFTIRDVLWLTALVALGAAWWADHRNMASRMGKIEADNELLMRGINEEIFRSKSGLDHRMYNRGNEPVSGTAN